MNVLMNLTEMANSQATDSIYRNLSKQILEHLDDMKCFTIYDLAEMTNSSRTTIWRLVVKLGYSSFSDFRYALQSAASQYTYYNRLVPSGYTVTSDSIIKKSQDELKDAAKLIKGHISPAMIEEMTDELLSYTKVRFYTPFRLGLLYSFQINLAKNGTDTAYFCMLPDMINDTDNLDENSLVIINTLEYAETLDMTQVFEKIKEKNAKIWLAGDSSTHYAEYADRHLLNVVADPIAWMFSFELLINILSERYREKFID